MVCTTLTKVLTCAEQPESTQEESGWACGDVSADKTTLRWSEVLKSTV